MNLSLSSTPYVPPSKKKPTATPKENKLYRILCNGELVDYIEASSAVSALSGIVTTKGPASPIRRISSGAVTDINNHHYQAIEA